MPLMGLSERDRILSGQLGPTPQAIEPEETQVDTYSPTHTEVLGSIAEETNSVAAGFAAYLRGTGADLPWWLTGETPTNGYDFISTLTDEEKDKYIQAGQIGKFVYAKDENEGLQIQKSIDAKLDNEKVFQQAPIRSLAYGMATGVADPVFMLPVIGQARFVGQTLKNGSKAISVLKTGASFGGAAAVGTGLQEAIIQTAQYGRSTEESLTNIGIDTLLTGLVGAGAGAFKNYSTYIDPDKILDGLADDLTEKPNYGNLTGRQGDAGAASSLTIDTIDLDDLTISGKAAKGLAGFMASEKFVGRTKAAIQGEGITFDPLSNPSLRVMRNSQSKAARITNLELTPFNLELNGYEKGTFVKPRTIKDDLDQVQSDMVVVANKGYDDIFRSYMSRLRSEGDNRKTAVIQNEFDKMVYLSTMKGGKSEITEVAQASKVAKDNVWEPSRELYNQAKIEAGDETPGLPEAPKGSEGYVPVSYNENIISDNFENFYGIVRGRLQRQVDEALEEFADSKKKRAEGIASYLPEELDSTAYRMTMKIAGDGVPVEDALRDFDLSSNFKSNGATASSLKKRKFQWDDQSLNELIEGGYVETNFKRVIDRYVGTSVRDVILAKRLGDIRGDKKVRAIQEEYETLVTQNMKAAEKAKKAGDKKLAKKLEKQVAKLRKQQKADVSDIRSMINIMRGVYNASDGSWISNVKNWNAMTLMGSTLESSFPDIARLGLSRSGARTIGRSLAKVIKEDFTHFGKRKPSVEQANDFNTALDLELSGQRASIITDTDNIVSRPGTITDLLSRGVDKMFTWNAMNWWNTRLKTVAQKSYTSGLQKRMEEFFEGSMSAKDKKRFTSELGEFGLTEAQARIVYDKFKTHGKTTGSLREPNTRDWDINTPEEAEAISIWKSGITTEVDTMIVTPHLDRSLFGSKGIGGLVMQFQSFGQSSFQRATLDYLQRIEKNPLQFSAYMSLIGQWALGGAVAYGKVYLAGLAGSKIYEQSKNWGADRWALEALDRSGITGNMLDIYNKVVQPTLEATGFAEQLGAEPLTRFQQRQALTRLLGPTYGLAEKVHSGVMPTVGKAVTGQAPKEAELMAATNALPYQSFLGIKYLLDGGVRSLDLD